MERHELQNLINTPLRPMRKNSSEETLSETASKVSAPSLYEHVLAGYLRAITVVLHVVVFVLHLLFLIGALLRPDSYIRFSPERQKIVSTIATISLQCFAIPWTTVMVFTTQQLVVRRDLYQRSTLTDLHDSNTAWQGLGGAVLTLWRQHALSAQAARTLTAVLYLGGIAALHTTIPAVLSVQVFNVTQEFPVLSRGVPQWDTESLRPNVLHGQNTLPYFGKNERAQTVGLHGSTLYDILDDNMGTGSVHVNATQYVFSCGTLPGMSHAPQFSFSENEDYYYTFDVEWEGLDTVYAAVTLPAALAQDSMKVFPSAGNTSSAVVVSTIPLVDANGNEGPARYDLEWSLNYTLTTYPDSGGVNNTEIDIRTVYIAVCRMDLQRFTTTVDAQTKQLIDGAEMDVPHDFSIESSFRDISLEVQTEVEPEILQMMYVSAQIAPLSNFDEEECPISNPDSKCEDLRRSVVDQYLMESLDVYPGSVFPEAYNTSLGITNPSRVPIWKVEEVLSNMTAAMFWAEVNMAPSKHELVQSGQVQTPVLAVTDATTAYSRQEVAALTVSIVPVAVGFAVSLMLLGLIAPLLAVRHNVSDSLDSLDSLGLLQVVWLMFRHEELQKAVGETTPTTESLRRTGMVEVCPAVEAGDARGRLRQSRSWMSLDK